MKKIFESTMFILVITALCGGVFAITTFAVASQYDVFSAEQEGILTEYAVCPGRSKANCRGLCANINGANYYCAWDGDLPGDGMCNCQEGLV